MSTEIGNIHSLYGWLAEDQGSSSSNIGRTVGLSVHEGGLKLRILGRMVNGLRMTKFFDLDHEKALDAQIVSALEVWNREAGF